MFRFFCRKCNKIKRVQHSPIRIDNQDAVNPEERIGECNYHDQIKREGISRFKHRTYTTGIRSVRPYASRFKFRRGGAIKKAKVVVAKKGKK